MDGYSKQSSNALATHAGGAQHQPNKGVSYEFFNHDPDSDHRYYGYQGALRIGAPGRGHRRHDPADYRAVGVII